MPRQQQTQRSHARQTHRCKIQSFGRSASCCQCQALGKQNSAVICSSASPFPAAMHSLPLWLPEKITVQPCCPAAPDVDCSAAVQGSEQQQQLPVGTSKGTPTAAKVIAASLPRPSTKGTATVLPGSSR